MCSRAYEFAPVRFRHGEQVVTPLEELDVVMCRCVVRARSVWSVWDEVALGCSVVE